MLKLRSPGRAKRAWLDQTAELFRQGTQLGLDYALSKQTSNRGKIHAATYPKIRALGLPSDYCCMAVNQAVQLARSHFGLRKSQRRTGKPTAVRSQGIGLGTNAYQVVGTALRLSTGVRGVYLWLPLCVPQHWRDRLQYVKGDARLFKRGEDWFVMLPLRMPTAPTVRDGDGQATVIGVDLGIVRLAAAKHPKGCWVVNGKPIRRAREHQASLRRRYGRHRRTDRVRAMRGKERRWMTDLNHKVSRGRVDLAAQYPHPVLAFERLDGIRDRERGSKRFNRMMSSWAFRQLADFVQYKVKKAGVRVVLVDPRKTSRTCPKCGHATRSNRTTQADFRCVACGYQGNADVVASLNIAGVAAGLRE
ncbi:MAG: RNA-guided endonuclease InsQ/TnpB family protein [Deinococcota bacterium]